MRTGRLEIERSILSIRGQNVMLDSDLAQLYGVETKALNQAVRRNLERFPGDFMFQLTAAESERLRSQSATSNTGRGGGAIALRNARKKMGLIPFARVSQPRVGGVAKVEPQR